MKRPRIIKCICILWEQYKVEIATWPQQNISIWWYITSGTSSFVGCVVTNYDYDYEMIFEPNKVGQTRFCVYLLLSSFAKGEGVQLCLQQNDTYCHGYALGWGTKS